MAIEAIEKHTAWIMDRGGKQRIHEITNIVDLQWGRERDEISQAHVTVSSNRDSKQADALKELATATGRYELCIWRDDVRVWEGPITLVTFKREGVEINARDIFHYGARCIMRSGYDNSYDGTLGIDYVTNRAALILNTEFARLEALTPALNVLPFLVNHQTATDAKTSRKTLPYQYTVYEHIDELAARSGIDYTVLGRAIHLWDTSKAALGYTATMTEADILGEMYVSVYGMELGTRAVVTDGQGTWGAAGGTDAYYGIWERLDTAYDEKAATSPTTAELVSQAQRNLVGRNPTPLQVRIPDNSTLNMNGVLTIDDLVPGVYVPLRATLNLVEVSQMQKLQNVKVHETPSGETVQVTLYPASDSDDVVS